MRPDAAPAHVIVVEDDDDSREVIAAMLANEGFGVSTFDNGAAALEAMRAARPDLVLLDLMMPVMDGWEFRAAQKRDPELARVPVVALTADGSAKARAIDAVRYLEKPFAPPRLLETVRQVLREIELERERERHAEAQRLAALGRLASGVAHAINNPLTHVLFDLGLVRDRLATLAARLPGDALVTEAAQLLADSLAGTERIAAVVRDVRVFSRADDEPFAPVDPRAVLESCLAITLPELERRARVRSELGPLPIVFGARGLLAQAFLHLLSNAADAIPEGAAPSHEVRIATRTAPSGAAVIEIADSGRGISPDVLGRIFDPFFTTGDEAASAGLGLAVCHGVVHRMGGRIDVASEPGKGTRFVVTLPPLAAGTASARATQPAPRSARARILIVDDERLIGRALERTLARRHDVVTCTSAAEALEALRTRAPFDVVLCDLLMPTMSGADLYAEVRRVLPGLEERFVFTTAGVCTSRDRAFLDSVRNPCIFKPFDVSTLEATIDRMIEGRPRSE